MKKYFVKLFLCVFLSMFFIEVFFKIAAFKTFFDIELFRIFLFTLTFSLITSILLSFTKPIVAKIISCFIIFIHSIDALLQLTFKGFMGNYMSLNMIFGGGEVDRISKEVMTFLSSINPLHWLLFLPFIVLIVFFIIDKKWDKTKKFNLKYTIIFIVFTILIHLSSLATLNITPETQIKSNKELYKTPTLIELALKEFGTQRFFIRDLVYVIFGEKTNTVINIVEKEEKQETDYTRYIDDNNWLELVSKETDNIIKNLDEYYINQSITDKNEYTGIFKDKNLILIMVEALDMAIIDEQLTPTLYKLTQEGWYFDNYYAPKFSCTTGESEFIAETSIIPSNVVCTPHRYVNNNYSTSIFNLFNKQGYTSTSYHGWDDTYYPRTKLHKNMGSTFYNSDDLGFSTKSYWTSDLEFMKKAYDVFKDEDKYFSFLITVSMHFSYEFSDSTVRKNWDKVKDLDTDITMKRYLAKAVEFDLSLEYLLSSLEEDGTLSDTVIVLFGDHHPYNLNFKYLDDFSDIDRYEGLNEDRLPFIIYNSDQEAKVISKTASTFDILPTVANLFDLDYDPRYYTGTDLFSNEESIAIFPNGNWITDNAIYYASKNKYELLNDEVDESYISKINNIVNNKFIASDNTLKKDYFKYRFSN